jgi:hypothetical protein
MADPNPTEPFFLIIADYDLGLFSVEGPMTARGTWPPAAHGKNTVMSSAARRARIATRWPANTSGRTS